MEVYCVFRIVPYEEPELIQIFENKSVAEEIAEAMTETRPLEKYYADEWYVTP